jgi:hypothetical protein
MKPCFASITFLNQSTHRGILFQSRVSGHHKRRCRLLWHLIKKNENFDILYIWDKYVLRDIKEKITDLFLKPFCCQYWPLDSMYIFLVNQLDSVESTKWIGWTNPSRLMHFDCGALLLHRTEQNQTYTEKAMPRPTQRVKLSRCNFKMRQVDLTEQDYNSK